MAMFFPDNYVVIDIETTGFEATSEIIELAAVKVVDNEITETFETLVKPKKAIQSNITEVTAITNAMVENAPPLNEVSSAFFEFIGDSVVVGHNIDNFDLKIIAYNTNHCIMNQTIDTLKLAKEILTMKHYTLQDVCNCYGVNNKQAHRALSDVVATHECYQHMKKGTEPIYSECIEQEKHFYKAKYSEETKALQTLQGILMGVTCDGILVESEVMLVKQWLDDNKSLSGNYPFDIAYSEIQKALEDGVLEQSELNSLLKTFIKLTDPLSTCSDKSKKNSDINLYGITVCLSGEFKHGTKEQVSELLVALGASVKETVTKKVGLLIVGDNGSADWRFGNYGGKVKKAMEMQEKGINIEILGEAEFYEKLEKINSDNQKILFDKDDFLDDFLNQMIEVECQKQNIASSFIQIITNTNGSKSIWICDPEWMLDFKGKRTQNALVIGKRKTGYEVTLSIGRNELADFVPVPDEATVKNTVQNYKNKTSVIFSENNSQFKSYIADVFAWELLHFAPSYQFSCCSRYEECSDNKNCIHQNLMYARGCQYRKNLESGRIFYGKNRTEV